MKHLIARFLLDEQGQDIIEYTLVGSFVSFGALLGAQTLVLGYTDWFRRWASPWTTRLNRPHALTRTAASRSRDRDAHVFDA